MGSLFRSEKMTLAQLFLQSEAAYACVRELGELDKVQFRDLNPAVNAFQRKFINEVRRCDEMERKLRYLSNELEKANIEVRPSATVEAPDPQNMIDLEGRFDVLESEVKEINANKETLKKNLLDLIELQYILRKTQGFFEEAEQYSMLGAIPQVAPPMDVEKGLIVETDDDVQKIGEVLSQQTRFTFVTGVICRERMATFERVLWRACRGNVFLRQAEIEEMLENPTNGQYESKAVFILFFQGDQLQSRVTKICEGFRATLYQCPETAPERHEMMGAVDQRINELRTVLQTTEQHSITQFNEIALHLDSWQEKVKKIKGIYHTMNMFNLDVTQSCLIAECWCPVEALEEIQGALTRGTERSGSTVPSILNQMKTDEKPPTYNKVNKFTRSFQSIVDAYGVATYEEVNPAPYTIITFPFLFAVMFGDAGHGILMALFGLTLILFEKKLANSTAGGEMFRTLFGGRYIVFLMGIFSIYTGLIYNDVFSKSLNIFGSSWDASYTSANVSILTDNIADCCPGVNTNCVIMGGSSSPETVFPREAMYEKRPYPFGLDPVWNVAQNKLLFQNSYKMKMAIILGVGQMLFGVILSIFNHVHFKRYINIVVEFFPQVLFLMCIFGWLVFMIFYKWCSVFVNPNTAPNLLITLINMFLGFGSSPKVNETTTTPALNEYSVFGPTKHDASIQRYIHALLVVVAVLCIPWMLCIKPFYLLYKNKKKARGYHHVDDAYHMTDLHSNDSDDEVIHHDEKKPEVGGASAAGDNKEHHEEEFEFGETFVHQSIHTIEYCLGTISNTASYLRLWALSLAHAELSEVLWTMLLTFAIRQGQDQDGWIWGAIWMFFLWAYWAVLTIGILLVMEGLSAFLHALRLHWVEFQNKFYEGDGYMFKPFSFEAIMKGEED